MDYKKIFLNEIPEEGLNISAVLTDEDFHLEVDLYKTVNGLLFKGLLQRFSSRLILSGELKGAWKLTCDRCLIEFLHPVKSEVLLHFIELKPGMQPSGHSHSSSEDEPEELVRDYIDLYQVFTEQMILQIPMKALCSAECKGLCSTCGQDLNRITCGCEPSPVDPRLSKLKDFLEK